MIKLTFCIHRLAHLTREEFQAHWLNNHAAIVQKNAGALNVRRYVQQHTLADPINDAIQKGRGTLEPFDGIAELWFDSVESMQAPASTPEGRAAMKELNEDESRLIDMERSVVFVGQEHELVS